MRSIDANTLQTTVGNMLSQADNNSSRSQASADTKESHLAAGRLGEEQRSVALRDMGRALSSGGTGDDIGNMLLGLLGDPLKGVMSKITGGGGGGLFKGK